MRILDLQLLAFGPFTNTLLDFSDDAGKLSIVYGPNEAGKSSSLRAISAALFGIPQQSRDNFLHSYKEMRVGVAIQNGSGDPLSFVRRKGKKSTMLDPASGAAIPEHSLQPFIGGLDEQAFNAIYAIDYDELERGGRQMQELRGLVGESIFAAGLGSGNLARVLSRLDEEATEIFGKSKRKTAIATAKKDYEAAVKQKRDAALPSAKWQEQTKQLKQARAKRDQIVRQMDEIRQRRGRLRRIRNSLSLLLKRAELEATIEDLGEVTELPESYSAEERTRIQFRLDEESKAVEAIQQQLDATEGLRAKANAIAIPDGLLENETDIVQLRQRLGAIQKATVDRDTTLRSQRGDIKAQLQHVVRDVSPKLVDHVSDESRQLEKLHDLQISTDCIVEIQRLGTQQAAFQKEVAEQEKNRASLTSAISSARRRLDELPETRDTSELQRHVQRTMKAGDLTGQIEARQAELKKLGSQSDLLLDRLGLWQGTMEDLLRLPVPLRETVELFEQKLQVLETDHERLLEAFTETKVDVQHLNREVEALENTLGIVKESELREHRKLRDQLWQLIEQAWLHGKLDTDSVDRLVEHKPNDSRSAEQLASCFVNEVRAADEIADGLREHANEVGRLTSAIGRKKNLEEKQKNLAAKTDCVVKELSEVQQQWLDEWSACGMSPLSPREMRGWLDRYAAILQIANQSLAVEAELDQLQQSASQFAQDLRGQLEELGQSSAANDLSALLQLATQLIEDQANYQVARTNALLEIQRMSRDHEEADLQLVEAQTQYDAWKSQWRVAMQQLGLPDTASTVQANQRLNQLNLMRDLLHRYEEMEMRIRQIDEDIDQFEAAVKGVTDRIAPQMSVWPAARAVAQLEAQLTSAQQDQIRLQGLNEQIAKFEEQLVEKTESQSELQRKIKFFHQLAGTSEADDLSELEASSAQLINCREELREIEDRILELGAGMSIAEIEVEADGQNVDELDVQLERSADELADIQRARDEAVANLRDLERLCELDDTASVAADADQRALGLLARMQTDAERYLQLRAASAILRHQIERHRAENQDPILAKASDLFSQITCDEFKELRTEYDESDQATIVGIRRRGDQVVAVDAMSGGTRDQLYLALRLAYLESRIRGNPMPLVIDDILIEFDNDRAQATLSVLSELARRTQVIFFTHHHHLIELAQQTISDQCSVHQLGSETKMVVEGKKRSKKSRNG